MLKKIICKTKEVGFLVSTVCMTFIFNIVVFATDNNTEASTAVKNLSQQIFNIFKYVGFLLTAWAVGQLVLAFKNEDGDSKTRAMLMLVCGILLFSIESIFVAVGLKV